MHMAKSKVGVRYTYVLYITCYTFLDPSNYFIIKKKKGIVGLSVLLRNYIQAVLFYFLYLNFYQSSTYSQYGQTIQVMYQFSFVCVFVYMCVLVCFESSTPGPLPSCFSLDILISACCTAGI